MIWCIMVLSFVKSIITAMKLIVPLVVVAIYLKGYMAVYIRRSINNDKS